MFNREIIKQMKISDLLYKYLVSYLNFNDFIVVDWDIFRGDQYIECTTSQVVYGYHQNHTFELEGQIYEQVINIFDYYD